MANFYRLDDKGHYRRLAPDAEGYMHCAVLPGLRLDPAWLWQHELPTLAQTLDPVRAMLAG